MRDRKRAVGSSKPSDAIGIDALTFLAENLQLFRRFPDRTGLEIGQLRAEAGKPSFFAGLLDFILAHKPTLMDFAGRSRSEAVACRPNPG